MHVNVLKVVILFICVFILNVTTYDCESKFGCNCRDGFIFSGRNLSSILPGFTWFKKTCVILNGNNFTIWKLKNWGYLPKELKCLFLRNSKMNSIEGQDIFRNLTKLMLLDIAYNNFTEESFKTILQSIVKSNVTILDISGNAVANKIASSSFFRKLCELRMNNCGLKNLKFLKSGRMKHVLRKLELQNNRISEDSLQIINDYVNLELLDLSGNPITRFSTQTFSRLKHLQSLFIANLPLKTMTFPGIKSSSLRMLNISNSFSFSDVNHSRHVFNMSVNLELLNLTSINLANGWLDEDLLELFSPMPNLRVLALSNTSLNRVPINVFNRMKVLKALDLSYNGISKLKKEYFENMSLKFRELYLNDNNITTITNTTFPYQFLEQLRKLHLFGNNFRCDCSLHWFRYWMKSHYWTLDALSKDKSHFVYKCYNPKENTTSLLIEFDPSYEDCFGLSIHEKLALSIVSLCFVIVGSFNVFTTIRGSSESCVDKQRKSISKCHHKTYQH